MSIEAAHLLRLTHIDRASTVIVAGAAGWVDTDVSATTGTNENRIWLVGMQVQTQDAGARKHGDTTAPLTYLNNSGFTLCCVDSSGHMDFYRNAAANATYSLIGYLE